MRQAILRSLSIVPQSLWRRMVFGVLPTMAAVITAISILHEVFDYKTDQWKRLCRRSNLGLDRRGVWVDRGCRAEFVTRAVANAIPAGSMVTGGATNSQR